MKGYHIYFILLKILVVIQVVLVFLKKMTEDSEIYIVTDTIFKISVALYLFIFFIVNSFPGLDFEDTVILRFSGMVMLYDIDYTGLLRILHKHFPLLPKISYLEYTSSSKKN